MLTVADSIRQSLGPNNRPAEPAASERRDSAKRPRHPPSGAFWQPPAWHRPPQWPGHQRGAAERSMPRQLGCRCRDISGPSAQDHAASNATGKRLFERLARSLAHLRMIMARRITPAPAPLAMIRRQAGQPRSTDVACGHVRDERRHLWPAGEGMRVRARGRAFPIPSPATGRRCGPDAPRPRGTRPCPAGGPRSPCRATRAPAM